ncbi:MAG: hypothetical protein ABR923_04615 [Terracidiphilus sp.]
MGQPLKPHGAIFTPKYPAPPLVHWAVLLVVWIAIVVATELFAPNNLWAPVASLVFAPWIMYLCIWLLRLDSKSKCVVWCDAYIVVKLTCAWLSIQPHSSLTNQLLTDVFAIASAILGIVTLFSIRANLLNHYNKREPIGIDLGPVMTFFFSYLYIQSQLYPIAQLKKRQAGSLTTTAGQTPLQ